MNIWFISLSAFRIESLLIFKNFFEVRTSSPHDVEMNEEPLTNNSVTFICFVLTLTDNTCKLLSDWYRDCSKQVKFNYFSNPVLMIFLVANSHSSNSCSSSVSHSLRQLVTHCDIYSPLESVLKFRLNPHINPQINSLQKICMFDIFERIRTRKTI